MNAATPGILAIVLKATKAQQRKRYVVISHRAETVSVATGLFAPFMHATLFTDSLATATAHRDTELAGTGPGVTVHVVDLTDDPSA